MSLPPGPWKRGRVYEPGYVIEEMMFFDATDEPIGIELGDFPFQKLHKWPYGEVARAVLAIPEMVEALEQIIKNAAPGPFGIIRVDFAPEAFKHLRSILDRIEGKP